MNNKTNYYNKYRTKSRVFIANVVFYSILLNWIFSGSFLFIPHKALFKNPLSVKAASQDLTWNFSNASDYSLGDTSLVEINSNSAKLKLRSQSTDANTKLLYLLDEGSGTTAIDSSSNNNNGTITNGTYQASDFNTGVSFNGVSSKIEVPDSASISVTGSNTLEGQVKLANNFSAGSSQQRFGIFDKGSYQLYFDNETGKVVYEIADATATNWTQVAGSDINGSWDLDGNLGIESNILINGIYYVGTGTGTGDAEVWSWNGTRWTQIGGDGLNNCWPINTFEAVNVMATDGTNLFVGLGTGAGDAEVWSWNGTTWTKLGGDALNNSWQVNTFEGVFALSYFNSTLYAGLGTSANDAEVWSWDGTTWTKIGGDSLNSGWTTNYEYVYAMANDGTNLYVGLGLTAGDAEVWRWNGSSWTRIGGDAVNSSWANSTYEYVLSLNYFGGNLYAGLGVSANDAEVWKYNGTDWTQIGGDSLNNGWTTNFEGVYSMTNDGSNLYVGLGLTNGDNEVWSWNGTTWAKIGGDGLNGSFSTTLSTVNTLFYDTATSTLYVGIRSTSSSLSGQVWTLNAGTWTQIGGDYVNFSWGFRGLQSVEVMVVSGDKLYAGTGVSTAGNAMVWEYDGTSWTLIGGQKVNGSWNANTYESVTSMISHKGTLYISLGISANDAEVWRWKNNSWEQVGGDSLNSGWTTNFEDINSMASYGGYLYAGLGNSANDAEVWRFDDSDDTWFRVGGDSINNGWTTNFERVQSMVVFENKLYVGLGLSTGDAEVWMWDGASWLRVGGDGVNSSWANSTYETVESLIPYNGKVYAGLGNSAGDGEVWEYNGTDWTQIGGDDLNGSWADGTYEKVKTLVVYNARLYAGLGNSAGDGEVWRYNGSNWTQIGGDSLNSGWGSGPEEVESFSVYKGKLYAGTGYSANADATIWSYGNSGYLESTTNSFTADTWYHIAATYDGATMRLYINGNLESSVAASKILPDNTLPLLIGATYAGREYGKPAGYLEGSLDELRISNIARTSFVSSPFSDSAQTVTVNNATAGLAILSFDNFAATSSGGGSVKFRFSTDGGTTFLYYNGSAFVQSSSLNQSNTAAQIGVNLSNIPVTSNGLIWQAILVGNGDEQVSLDSVTLSYTTDSDRPTLNAQNVTLQNATNGEWTNIEPRIEWDAATDAPGGSGILGYCIALEEAVVDTDPLDGISTSTSLNPESSAGSLLNVLDDGVASTACPYIVTTEYFDISSILSLNLTSNKQYYFSIKAIDNADNVYSGSSTNYQDLITFKYDNQNPDNVDYLITPQRTFGNINDMSVSWLLSGSAAPSDSGSGMLGFQYQLNSTSSDGWKGTNYDNTLGIYYIPADRSSYDLTEGDDGAQIVVGTNVFYFRVVDLVGNYSTTISGTLEYGGKAPTFAKECTDISGITVTPSTSVSNNFALSWGEASPGEGQIDSYYYMINRNPPATLDTLQSNSTIYSPTTSTSVSTKVLPGSVKGSNTVYVVAVDDGGNYSSSNCLKGVFTLNSTLPDPVKNLTAVDASIKSESLWRASISWDAPDYTGTGELTYTVQRSEDNSTWATVDTTLGRSYTQTVPESKTYYYRVGVNDTTNASIASPTYSTSVDVLTKGSYDTAPALSSEPTVTAITTKRATISWSTGRVADSRIAYGTSGGEYFDSEPSSSVLTTSHQILLTNLSPGTKYYFVAKWTDEDGNSGVSDEYTFTTSPAPSVSTVDASNISISSATIKFKSKNGVKANLQYGETPSYGGSESISISTAETEYSINLANLKDDTTYHYRLILEDNEADIYEFEDHIFKTLPRPKITDIRVQQVPQAAQPMVLILWKTNTPVTSVVTYTASTSPLKEVDLELKTLHKMLLKNLVSNTKYSMVVSGTDKIGNEATSDAQYFTTSTDTRPPAILNLEVKSIIKGSGDTAQAQIVVSWDTDEPTTSQVEYGQGTGTSYSQKSGEDKSLVTNHTVVLTNLSPAQVYHLRAISKDSSANVTESIDTVTVTPKSVESALDLVVQNLSEAFGFIKRLQ